MPDGVDGGNSNTTATDATDQTIFSQAPDEDNFETQKTGEDPKPEDGEDTTQEVVEDDPKAAAFEKEPVSLDDFKAFKGLAKPVVTAKKEPATVDDKQATKTGEEKSEEKETPDEKVTEAKPAVTSETTTQVAELAPLLEKHKGLDLALKNMSKPSREFVLSKFREFENTSTTNAKAIAERDEALKAALAGKTQVPQSYYENPHAYQLLPEFQQMNNSTMLSQQIEQHWRQQRKNIFNGAPWRDLDEVKDAKGNVVGVRPSDKELPANGDAQDLVDGYWQDARTQLNQFAGYRENIIQQHQQGVQQVMGTIKKAVTDLFPPDKWDNKETAEFKLTENVRAGLRQLGVTPANPLFDMLAKAGAELIRLKDYVAAQQTSTTKKAEIAKDARKAGPTGNKVVSGGGGGGSNESDVTMDMFRSKLIS